MKKTIIAVITGLAVSALAYEVEVSTTAIKVMPQRGVEKTIVPDWSATNAYVNGEYINIGNIVYMCLVDGTSTNSLPSVGAEVLTEGTVTWVKSKAKGRQFGVVTKDVSNSDVSIGLGVTPTTESGFKLYDKGSYFFLSPADEYDGEISAISASGTNTLVIGDE